MRINFIGNVCNNAYMIAKFLRKKGIDAHLFVLKPYHPQYLPESEDPELLKGYPSWIEIIDSNKFRWTQPFLRHPVYEKKLLERLSKCDIVHAFDWGPAYALFSGRPFIVQACGSELNSFPFVKLMPDFTRDSLKNLMKSLKMRQGINKALQRCIMGENGSLIWLRWLTRKSLRRAKTLIVSGTSPTTYNSINRLGLNNVVYMRLLIDCEKYKNNKMINNVELINDKREFAVFSSTRHIWNNVSSLMISKGNDIAIRAFALFLHKITTNTKLYLIEKGEDVNNSKQLIKKLGIETKVIWLPFIPRNELIKLYSAVDVVFDQFFAGCLGTAALEAMCCEAPLITYLYADGIYFKKVFGEIPPVLNCKTVEQIFNALHWCYFNQAQAKEIGKKAREWVWKHYHWENTICRYIGLYEDILRNQKNRIRNVHLSLKGLDL